MADIVLSPRQKYRLMLLDGIEKALQLSVKDNPKGMWKYLRGLAFLLSRYMPEEIRKEVVNIIEIVKEREKSIKEDKQLSSTEKEAKLKEVYEQFGQELFDYLAWVITHSPVVGMDIEGALFVHVESVEDINELGEIMKKMKYEVEAVEGPPTPEE